MEKIRLITFHTPKNYGAVLQALSLMNALTKYSDDVKVIDYNTPKLRSAYPLIERPQSFKGVIFSMLNLPHYFKNKRRHERFDDFVKNNLILTERFESTEDLYNYDWGGCTFVTGSDQVFNPGRIVDERKAFYLGFVPDANKKISYAASFGVKNIDDEKKEEICDYIERFDALGVREVSGAQIISDLLGKDAQVLMDPVFLNDVDFWKKYASSPKKVKGEYLLYYRLMGAKICDSEIIELAKKLKLKLVIITSSFINPAIKANILRDVGPSEFLWLYEHASYVATDSFHGIAFSIIYKKQFVFLDRNYATNDRGLNLLSLLGIKESAYIDSYSCDNKIDYAAVDQRLSLKRKECLDYLEKNCT